MTDAANPSGLTDDEAQEFHQYYVQGYILWAVGAFAAHSLVWIWRPWFQGTQKWRYLWPK